MLKQHGFIKSVGKCYTYQNLIPIIDGPYINAKRGTWSHGVDQLVVLWNPLLTTDGEVDTVCGPPVLLGCMVLALHSMRDCMGIGSILGVSQGY